MKNPYREMVDRIKRFFQETSQASWGKNQIVVKIDDIKLEVLQEFVDDVTDKKLTAREERQGR